MSLKAGRVGVNPADVDPVDGHISPSSMSAYTKQEADAKFETQEAALSLQPKTLELPIQLLSGSKLTVEDSLHGIVDEIQNTSSSSGTYDDQVVTTVYVNSVQKLGKLVLLSFSLQIASAIAYVTPVLTLPVGYRPAADTTFITKVGTTTSSGQVKTNGDVILNNAIDASTTVVGCAAFFI